MDVLAGGQVDWFVDGWVIGWWIHGRADRCIFGLAGWCNVVLAGEPHYGRTMEGRSDRRLESH